jgi:hypothetical protein
MLELEAQVLPQEWVPAAQVNPQEFPSQVAVALAGGTQAAQEAPQVATLVLDAQLLPQA